MGETPGKGVTFNDKPRYMPKHLLPLLTCSLVLSGTMASAQQGIAYLNQSVTFRSDFPAKSVLVSSITPDKAGDASPIIGYASWNDQGGQFQCRSYLRFGNLNLPRNVVEDPSLITRAELILYPVSVQNNPDEKDKISRFTVRRVLENWTDTATRWVNQPTADSLYEVKWVLRKKQKEKLVSVDVTGLVMDMVRYENNGFLISYDSTGKSPASRWQWFASPWYEDEGRRPLLVIHYKQPYTPNSILGLATNTESDIRRAEDLKQTRAANSGPVPAPVNTPPANPKEQQ